VTVDPNHPWLVAAGSNDNIDMEACNAGDDTTCPFTLDVGGSGVTSLIRLGPHVDAADVLGDTARSASCDGMVDPSRSPEPGCVAFEGDIGTLPWYYENGLVSDGDPALAFGPVPDEDGIFDWDNGSRLYYANLTSNLSTPGPRSFNGYEAVAVSRLDVPVGAAPTDGLSLAEKADWLIRSS
jgi:hypothetical protein